MSRASGEALRQFRLARNLSQTEFWARVGISQPTGSRYELGDRPVMKPVKMLLELAYGKNSLSNLARLRGEVKTRGA